MSHDEALSRDAAIWAHQALAASRDHGLGPRWRFPDPAGVADLQAMIRGLLAEVRAGVDHKIYWAPTPWHAALWCSKMQSDLVARGGRVLLRGQSDAAWPLTPSIARAGVDARHELNRADLFSRILASLSLNTVGTLEPGRGLLMLKVGEQSYLAAAQHYGVRTPLLDFTTDPDVAVWFAAHGEARESDYASIVLVPIGKALAAGARMILPPPFVSRLYAQRGVFLDTDGQIDLAALGGIEVRFPNNAAERAARPEFFVRRDGGQAVSIMPEEQGLGPARALADEILSGQRHIATEGDLAEAARALKPHFASVYQNPVLMWAELTDHFENQLYQLVYAYDEQDRFGMDVAVFEALVAANLEVCASIAALYRHVLPHQPPSDGNRLALQRADMIDAVAAQYGYSHAEETQAYRRRMNIPG